MNHLMLEAQRAKRTLQSQTARIQQLRRIADIVMHMRPSVPSYVRPLLRGSLEERGLQTAANRRAEELYQQEMVRLAALPPAKAHASLAQLLQGEWRCLSGNFPKLAYQAQQELIKLKGKIQS